MERATMPLDRPMIAGDWGNSHLRLFLCRGADILAGASGPGVGALDGRDPRDVMLNLIAAWREEYDPASVILCGAIGSTLGWRVVPYLECPAHPGEFAAGALRFETDGLTIAIAPGLACINPSGAPDVLRGEETQIAGALRIDPHLAAGDHLLCLPGTHSKWVHLSEGRVGDFVTGMTGELFALLEGHSTLLRGGEPSAISGPDREGFDPEAFDLGLARAETQGMSLIHAMFEVRSRRLRAGLSLPAARSFLSGLLIGADSMSALACYPSLRDRPAIVIGAPGISDLYARCLHRLGMRTVWHDGAAAVIAGLRALHDALPQARE